MNSKKYYKKRVAVIVPMYKKEMTEDEKISMRYFLKFLNNYDKFIISPKGKEINHINFKTIKFNKKYFKSAMAYSKLLLKKEFYKKFINYEYILIYQLDAMVFSDQLLVWCDKGYDYIGAPWFKSELEKVGIKYNRPDSCGNGGFSLRNINNSILVLEKARKNIFTLIKEIFCGEVVLFKQKEKRVKEYLKVIKRVYLNSSAYKYPLNEDFFWSFEAKKNYPDFKIPSVDVGLKFSFEVGPRYCFDRNHKQLPFGCHAWTKYDKNFWNQYLLK